MNRTDRLLAIVLELQGRERVTAEELARTFEVTKRTIYRDIAALNESGVPVVSAAGQGYWLMEGYFLPPVSLSSDEAVMLILGSEAMAQTFDAQYQGAASSASRKIEALLNPETQTQVAYLKNSIRFFNPPRRESSVPDFLRQLRRAIIERKTAYIHYTKKAYGKAGAFSERTIDPHGLIYFNAWMLYAYCHMRSAMRMFRLDRITKLELLDITFTRQPNISMQKLSAPKGRNQVIKLLFDTSIAQWVKESPVSFISAVSESKNGLKVTLKVRDLEEAVSWILSWGAKVEVLEPAALKTRLKKELEAMLQMIP